MKTLIEVGAFDGSDSLGFHSRGQQVQTFEPKKDLYENLVNKTKNLKNYNVSPKAVCATNGLTTFNICRSGGASSILPFRSDDVLAKTWPGRGDILYSGESYEVQTTRLDTFIEEKGLQNTSIDYIHIDAQGVDLECLMSLGPYIRNVKEGVLETVINPEKSIQENQETNNLENTTKYLTENGFRVLRVESNDGCNAEYNVIFVRN